MKTLKIKLQGDQFMNLKQRRPKKNIARVRVLISFLCMIMFTASVLAVAFSADIFEPNNITTGEGIDLSQNQNITDINAETKEISEKQLIVKYKNSISQSSLKSKVKSFFGINEFESKKVIPNSKIELLEVSDTANINAVISALQADSNVEYVQPNYILEASSLQDEPDFTKQWGLYNDGEAANGYPGRSSVDINVMQAWGTTTGSSEVIVGILDTGIDVDHDDLKDNIYVNIDEIPDNGIDDDGNGYIDDGNGWNFVYNNNFVHGELNGGKHGTAVAGIIAAAENNKGITGVAPTVKLLPLKFMSGYAGTTADAIEAIAYAENLGVKIINCSFGTYEYNQALKDAMENSDIFFVCAAGNQAKDSALAPFYPASFNLPNIISVAAINNNGVLASFSNYGSFIDVAAPGTNIYATSYAGSYTYASGTSFSAAYVTGTAALLASNNSNLSASDIKSRIKNNATVCSTLTDKVNTGGRINAGAALLNTSPTNDIYTEKLTDEYVYLDMLDSEHSYDDSLFTQAGRNENINDETFNRFEGVHIASGAVHYEFTDFKLEGYDPPININRQYSSKPANWSFNFECSTKYLFAKTYTQKDNQDDIYYYSLTLPDGNTIFYQRFIGTDDTEVIPVHTRTVHFEIDMPDIHTLNVRIGDFNYRYYTTGNKNTDAMYLTKITDKQGKELNFTIVNEKVTGFTDYKNNHYTVTRTNDEITKITNDTTGEFVSYTKTANLRTATNFSGTTKYHTSGDSLIKIVDKDDNTIREFEYHSGERIAQTVVTSTGQGWVTFYQPNDVGGSIKKMKNEYGHETNFNYSKDKKQLLYRGYYTDGSYISFPVTENTINKCEIEYKNNEDLTKKLSYDVDYNWFASLSGNWQTPEQLANGQYPNYLYPTTPYSRRITKAIDEEGGETTYEYHGTKIIPKTVKDRNGNISQTAEISLFEHPTKMINPDNSIKLADYDNKGNLVFLQDENEKVVLYRHTYDGQYLIKIEKIDVLDNSIWTADTNNGGRAVKDTNGQPVINNPTADKCAITTYECTTTGIRGLINKHITPEGVIIHYTYDTYGNIATSWVVDSEINPNSAKKSIYTHYVRLLNSTNNTVREVAFGTAPATNEIFLGRKVKSVSPEGYTTENYYTPNGLLEKSDTYSNITNKSTIRIVYDAEGRKIQEISPNQYIEADDDLKNHIYNNQTVGKRWTYHPSGKIETETDEEGNTTTYTYDSVSAGVASVTYPNGSMNTFEYDALGKRTKTYFKDNANAAAVLISEYETFDNFESGSANDSVQIRSSETALDTQDNFTSEYDIADGSKTLRILKKYHTQNSNGTTDTTKFDKSVLIYDYRNELIKTINPDGSITKKEYNQNGTLASEQAANGGTTHFYYDNLNRVTDKWEPFEGATYKHIKTKYNNDNQIISEITKKSPVSISNPISPVTLPTTLNATDYLVKNYTYYSNGKKNIESDNEGHKTKNTYDCDGNLTGEYVYIIENPTTTTGIPTIGTEATATTYTYTNKRPEKPDKKTVYVRKNEISGNTDTTTVVPLVYDLTYDKSGNLKTEKSPSYTADDGTNYPSVTITKNYDLKNRLTDTIVPDSYVDLSGTETSGNITESTEYNWEDNVISKTDGNGNITTYEYNPAGFLTKEITQVGVTAFENDLQGRKIIEVSPQNYVPNVSLKTLDRTELSYNHLNKVTKQTEVYRPFNINTNTFDTNFVTKVSKQLEYDGIGNIKKEIDAFGNEKSYVYYLNGKLKSETDAETKDRNLPHTKYFTYDTLDRLLTEKDAKNNTTTYAYNDQTHEVSKISNISTAEYDKIIYYQKFDLLGNVIKSATNSQKGNTVTNGAGTTYFYGLLNQLIQENAPSDDTIDENIIKYKYDISGNLTFKTDSFGQIELFTYNNRGLETSHTIKKGADGTITSTKYDKNGNIKVSTDGNNGATHFHYDSLNRQTSETLNNKSTTYTYNKNGSTLTVSNWRGNISENVYDKLNRLVLKKDPTGQIIEKLEYNGNHSQSAAYTPHFNGENYTFVKTEWLYDKNNRLKETIDPLGNSIIKTYDDLGNLETQSDGKDNFMQYKYDSMGRLTEVITPADGGTASNIVYTYNRDSQKTSQRMGEVNGDGKTKTYEYNCVNLIKASVTPDEKAETYNYYPNGLLSEKLDKNGITTTYSYNYAGLLTNETAGTELAHFEYDSVGNATKHQNSNSLVTRLYDAENRVYSKTQDSFGVISYQYDITAGLTNGETAELSTYPDGTQVKKVFDKVGRLIRVYHNSNLEVTYDYYINGQQKSMTYPNGIVTAYTYYENQLLESMIIKKGVEALYNFNYEYDSAGNLIYKDEIKEQSFGYNNKNMLIWEKDGKEDELNGMTNMYEYDSNFNRVKQYSADLSLFEAEINTIYDYDKRNRLITLNNGTTHTFSYNAEGYRIKKTGSIGTTGSAGTILYAYESNNPIAEYSVGSDDLGAPNNLTITAFNLFGTKLICRIEGSQKYYYIYNSHGDVIALTDENGDTISTYEYDSWGNILNTTTADDQNGNPLQISNPFRYSGYIYDEETKLYYLNARYYDPLIGRFITEDTVLGEQTDPLSLNLYTYAHNNPLKYNDPTGHYAETLWDYSTLVWSIEGLLRNSSDYRYWIAAGLNVIDLITPFVSGLGEAYMGSIALADAVVSLNYQLNKQADDIMWQWERDARAVQDAENKRIFEQEEAEREAIRLAQEEKEAQEYRARMKKLEEDRELEKAEREAEEAAQREKEETDREAANKELKGDNNGNFPNNEQPKKGRSKNNLKPNPNAQGAHSTFKRDPKTGKITNYKTWKPNPRNPKGFDEVKGYDGVGEPHFNKFTKRDYMPHIHDKTTPGGVREPQPWEIPGWK